MDKHLISSLEVTVKMTECGLLFGENNVLFTDNITGSTCSKCIKRRLEIDNYVSNIKHLQKEFDKL